MNDICAFVGHSFNAEDEAVVSAFQKYFNQLAQSTINFSWVSAEPAEPKELAAKVMALLSDRNVFIGICTRKELVTAPEMLKATVLPRGFLRGRKENFLWKTSDWIIQEIGLAIGKGLGIILLLEVGVEKPGGLQGNIEYIPFDRNSPEKSFGKVLEMINALSPKKSVSVSEVAETRSVPSQERKESTEPEGDNWSSPKPDWTRRQYEFALMQLIGADKTEHIADLSRTYLATVESAKGDNKQRWEALGEYLRLALGKGGTVANLKKLVEAYPDSSATIEQLARAYSVLDEHHESARTYEVAANKALDAADRLRLMGKAAAKYAAAQALGQSTAIVNRMKAEAAMIPDSEVKVLRVLLEISKTKRDNESTIGLMERIVEMDPDDNSMRFSLAYKHSEMEHHDLSLFHYLKIPELERGGAAWNNIGVEFGHADLSAKSIEAFKKAEDAGETLAMSNIADKFITAGFLDEAKAECDKALKVDDFHQNVGLAFAKIKQLPGEETARETELLAKTMVKCGFYREFGRALALLEANKIAQLWEGPDCTLSATVNGNRFSAEGTYEPSGLSLAFAGALAIGGAIAPNRFKAQYVGTIFGRAIEGWVTRVREGDRPKSMLDTASDAAKVLMVLVNDSSEFKVMEISQGNATRYYSLKAKNSAA